MVKPKPVLLDIHIGKRLRHLRGTRQLSQGVVAKALGISFQQIQKYETGKNRISASRLYYIAKVFEIEINYFYDRFKHEDGSPPPSE